jgi:hypothetical protein
MKLEYANAYQTAGQSRHWVLRSLTALPVAYVLGYIALRCAGGLYPFYNQGSWDEMDGNVPEVIHIIYYPVSELELVYHNLVTPPPSGG